MPSTTNCDPLIIQYRPYQDPACRVCTNRLDLKLLQKCQRIDLNNENRPEQMGKLRAVRIVQGDRDIKCWLIAEVVLMAVETDEYIK